MEVEGLQEGDKLEERLYHRWYLRFPQPLTDLFNFYFSSCWMLSTHSHTHTHTHHLCSSPNEREWGYFPHFIWFLIWAKKPMDQNSYTKYQAQLTNTHLNTNKYLGYYTQVDICGHIFFKAVSSSSPPSPSFTLRFLGFLFVITIIYIMQFC